MMEKRVMNRSYVVFAAILIQLCLGVVYAWSVFTPSLVETTWTITDTQIIFAAVLAMFSIAMVISGRLLPKIGPRKLVISGGIILGAGYILAGLFGGTDFWSILFFIGVIGGSGLGLAYVAPIAVAVRWFPDRRGWVSGVAVASFCFGAMLWIKLASSWGQMIANKGLSLTFVVYGIILLVAIVIGGIWMVFPPVNWRPAGWNPPAQNLAPMGVISVEMQPAAMLKTPQFYMIFLTFVCAASAGLMSVGLMMLFSMVELGANGVENASAVAGTAIAIFFLLANGIGRISWGAMSDKLGRKNSVIAIMAIQGVIVILFQWMAGNEYLLYLGASLIGFNYGGNFALFPMITADTFGVKFVGQNYGWVFLSYGVGGLFGPLLGGMLGDMGNFHLAFSICGSMCLASAVIIAFVRPPQKA